MAVLDKVMEMQKQGMQDAEINKKLTDEGASPREINDSLNQAKVKTAVSQDIFPESQQMPPEQAGAPTGQPAQVATEEMEQSIMQPGAMPPAPEPQAAPQAQAGAPEAPQMPPEQAGAPTGQPAPEEGQYYAETPQAYPEEGYYPEQAAINIDTVTEIAEQIVSEKFREFKEKTGDIASFQSNISEKVNDLDDRLKRIEDSIEKLQQSIIGKMGEFGENSLSIHKDLDNLHNTVSKLMNPLVDNYKELKKIAKGKNQL